MTETPQFADYLRRLRHSKKLSLKDVRYLTARKGRKVVYPGSLSQFENGLRLPKLADLSALAVVYETTIGELAERYDQEVPE